MEGESIVGWIEYRWVEGESIGGWREGVQVDGLREEFSQHFIIGSIMQQYLNCVSLLVMQMLLKNFLTDRLCVLQNWDDVSLNCITLEPLEKFILPISRFT